MHDVLYLKLKMLFFCIGLFIGFYNPPYIKHLIAINILLAVGEGFREGLALNSLMGLGVFLICMHINWKTTDLGELLGFLIPFSIWNIWFSISSKDDPLSALAHNLVPLGVALATLKMSSMPERALWNWGLVRVSMLLMLFIHGASPWAGCPTSRELKLG